MFTRRDFLITSTTTSALLARLNSGVRGQTVHRFLSATLEQPISAADAGEFDGNEAATDCSYVYLYMYGPDADKLFAAVEPVLQSSSFMAGTTVTKRYGPPEDGIRESVVKIAP